MTRPRIGITVGDPAGIGPEIAEKAAADPGVQAACDTVLYGPAGEAARQFAPGVLSAAAGRTAFEAVVAAVEDARAGRLDAIATGPVSKAAFALAGLPWKGHTDLLAHLCGAPRVAMLFHSEPLRVVLATVHVPLAEVPRALTPTRLTDAIELAAEWLPWLGYPRARLAVAGLNPHAGEDGLIGQEDREVIAPVVEALRARGVEVAGPFPADTIFVRAASGEFDAVVACYHDQGLVPIKLLAFRAAVNVTLGLPIVRTSVDHGTAFDIAGRGTADPASLVAAVHLACRLARARRVEPGTRPPGSR